MLYELFMRCLSAKYEHSPDGGNFALEREGDTLYIFLEHSDGEKDWMNNFDFPASGIRAESGYAVHRGFLRVWESMEPYLRDAVADLTIEKIITVGYSHGGALAVLCHEYLWWRRPDLRDTMEGYGFAAPRVVHGFLSSEMKARWERFSVVRIPEDLVTHLPPRLFGFHHVGRMVELCRRGKYGRIDAHRAASILRELEGK